MAGLEELKKKLQPLLFDDSDKGGVSTRVPLLEDTCDSYVVSDGGTINLLSRSFGEYNINEHGFHKRSTGPEEPDTGEKAYRCASEDMHIFGPIGNGASSVVQRAIFIPVHRILALKKINIFEKNDEDVKVVVGKSLDQLVLDESQDVLLEIYAPWCGHCQSQEPIYNKLAKFLHGIDSLVITKMDGTNNEHPRA